MYLSYFGFAEAPFSIAPDPRYLYMTRGHQEALAHLLYGVNGDGGFVLLTGEVGAGKTTVCRCLIEQIPETCDVAYVFNPRLTVEELLAAVCLEFGITYPPGNTSIGVFVDCINAYLLDANARGRHTVLIIDEAQNLSAEVLEQMRLLTNLETNQRKLLQIILLGQPELAEMLDRPSLRQLAQRIVARYHLGALNKSEVAAYVQHRLEVSGSQRQLFPKSLMSQLYRLSKGVPRIINVLCDRALLGAYTQGQDRVDRATLAQAAREVFGQRTAQKRTAAFALTIAAAAMLTFYAYYYWARHDKATVVPPLDAGKAVALDQEIAAAAIVQSTELPEKPFQTLTWPKRMPREGSQPMANAALFKAWGAKYESGDACLEAVKAGLRCRTARGGLDELRQMNRPAVITLRDEQGQEFHATLIRLDGKTATLSVSGVSRAVALEALAVQWSGHYTVLWRLPPQAQEHIKIGDVGPAVAWLNKQLPQRLGGNAQTGGEPVFDDAMARRIRQFQLMHGLIPDGIIGSQTLIRLSALSDSSAPQLAPSHGEK